VPLASVFVFRLPLRSYGYVTPSSVMSWSALRELVAVQLVEKTDRMPFRADALSHPPESIVDLCRHVACSVRNGRLPTGGVISVPLRRSIGVDRPDQPLIFVVAFPRASVVVNRLPLVSYQLLVTCPRGSVVVHRRPFGRQRSDELSAMSFLR
jgi:hypothetical protein